MIKWNLQLSLKHLLDFLPSSWVEPDPGALRDSIFRALSLSFLILCFVILELSDY